MNRRLFNVDTCGLEACSDCRSCIAYDYLVEQLVDNVINFTGTPLVVAIYVFYVIWYVSASVLVFFVRSIWS